MLSCMEGSKTTNADLVQRSPEILSRSTIRRYAAGSIGTGGFGTLPGLVLVYYLTDSLGVTALLAGVIIMVAKLWDVIIDPVIGEISDASLQKTGSRRRLMIIGAIALPIFFVLTFAVPAPLTGLPAALWVLVCFIGAATAFSLFQVPYISLPAELTNNYDQRTKLLTWRVVVLTVAILAFGGGGPALRELAGDNVRLGYLIMAVVAGAAFMVAFLIAARVAPQNAQHNPRKSPLKEIRVRVFVDAGRQSLNLLKTNQAFRTLLGAFFLQALATGLMLASAQYVATWILDSQAAVTFLFAALIAPALLMAPVWGRIALKRSKEQTFLIATVLFIIGAVSLIALLWFPGTWIYLPVALCGAGYAGMQSLPMAMLPDVISHSLSQGQGSEDHDAESLEGKDFLALHFADEPRHDAQEHHNGAGLFGGVWTAGETTGMALGSTVLTVLLALSGYAESVAGQSTSQPDSALVAIVLTFSVIPALCAIASVIPLRRYPLSKSALNA